MFLSGSPEGVLDAMTSLLMDPVAAVDSDAEVPLIRSALARSGYDGAGAGGGAFAWLLAEATAGAER